MDGQTDRQTDRDGQDTQKERTEGIYTNIQTDQHLYRQSCNTFMRTNGHSDKIRNIYTDLRTNIYTDRWTLQTFMQTDGQYKL